MENWIRATYKGLDVEHEVRVRQGEPCSRMFIGEDGTMYDISDLDFTESKTEDFDVFKQCDEEILRVKEAFRKRKGLALDKWAYDNARFHRADIIESRGTIILVDSRIGHKKMYANELYVEYRGPQLTRKLEPRKDGQTMSIYDDGREVKKIATGSINRDNSVSAKQKSDMKLITKKGSALEQTVKEIPLGHYL